MNRDVLANHIARANLDSASRLRFETQILRPTADDRAVTDHVARTNSHRTVNYRVGLHDRAPAKGHFAANTGIRSDLNLITELRPRIDDRGRMNFHSMPASLKLKYGKRPSAGAPMMR